MCLVASCLTSQVIAYLASKLSMPQASLATKPEEDLRKVTPRCFALHRLIYFDLQLARQCLDALCKGQAHLSNNRVAPEVKPVE
jgi:hypothetical protein